MNVSTSRVIKYTLYMSNYLASIPGTISGRAGGGGGIAALRQIYMGAPIGVVEIHVWAKLLPLSPPTCSATGYNWLLIIG